MIRSAANDNIPVLIPCGAVEYHGPHLPVGADTLIADTLADMIEKNCRCIVMPHIPYSPTYFWAGAPTDGEIDFSSDALYLYAKELFKGLLKVGFRRIYVIQHHQGQNGAPDVCLKKAAADVIAEVSKEYGAGWGARLDNKYGDILSAVKVFQLDSFTECDSNDGLSHAGKLETEIVMQNYGRTVDMSLLTADIINSKRYLKNGRPDLADKKHGEKILKKIADSWIKEINKL